MISRFRSPKKYQVARDILRSSCRVFGDDGMGFVVASRATEEVPSVSPYISPEMEIPQGEELQPLKSTTI